MQGVWLSPTYTTDLLFSLYLYHISDHLLLILPRSLSVLTSLSSCFELSTIPTGPIWLITTRKKTILFKF